MFSSGIVFLITSVMYKFYHNQRTTGALFLFYKTLLTNGIS